ncbi:unnamed protein product [Parnassius apollo]|uniref:(apollo) hypothetical protein n=1 Tax=Parnassius apollo TaxID=110799 RepID=A0A8S3XHC5_PARAO|nr:unnamed protein product [Parnassius apollo]
MSRGAWWRAVRRGAGAAVAGAAAGVCAAAAAGTLLHAAGARLLFYARPQLLLPLYALPAVCGWWWGARAAWRGGGGAALRGWWRARAYGDALCVLAGGTLLCCAAAGLRSAFLPLLWALMPAAADAAASLLRLAPRGRALCWVLGGALPAAQTCYLALASLDMFVPIMGRAGTPPLPPDVIMAVLVGALTITALSWALPLVVAANNVDKLLWAMAGMWAASSALALAAGAGAGAGAAYSAARPQRVLLFHVRRTEHAAGAAPQLLYWLPEIDTNTPRSLLGIGRVSVEGMEAAQVTSAEDCARWVYCGAPYYLPVRSLVARGHQLPAASAPLTRLHARLQLQRLQRSRTNGTLTALHLHLHGEWRCPHPGGAEPPAARSQRAPHASARAPAAAAPPALAHQRHFDRATPAATRGAARIPVARGHQLPAASAPLTRLHARLQLQRLQRSRTNGTLTALHLQLHGEWRCPHPGDAEPPAARSQRAPHASARTPAAAAPAALAHQRHFDRATPAPTRYTVSGAARIPVTRGHQLPAASAPLTRLHARLQLQRLQRSRTNGTLTALHLHLHGDGARYVVCVVSPVAGARVSWSSAVARPLAGPRWGDRHTYFFALHHARPQPSWHLELHIQHNLEREPEKLVDVSVAGHSLFGEDKLEDAHRRLLDALPAWTAPTGWGVDLHLYSL